MPNCFNRVVSALCVSLVYLLEPGNLEAKVCVQIHSTDACLNETDTVPLRNRIPIILIHGWNPDGIPAPPQTDIWKNLVDDFLADDSIDSAIKLYTFEYFSNSASVIELSRALRDTLDMQNRTDPLGFGTRPIFIIAHSMGGLIARYFMKLSQSTGAFENQLSGERVNLLITLGTPHHGSMLANGMSAEAKIDSMANVLFPTLGFFYKLLCRTCPDWRQPNRSDLRWDNFDGTLDYKSYPDEQNFFLESLNKNDTYDYKLVAYAGELAGCYSLKSVYCAGDMIIGNIFGQSSDGIVPLNSALIGDKPEWALKRRRFSGYNHREIAAGRGDGELFGRIKEDIKEMAGETEKLSVPQNVSAHVGLNTVVFVWNQPNPRYTYSFMAEIGSKTGASDVLRINPASYLYGNNRNFFWIKNVPPGTYYVRFRNESGGMIGLSSDEISFTVNRASKFKSGCSYSIIMPGNGDFADVEVWSNSQTINLWVDTGKNCRWNAYASDWITMVKSSGIGPGTLVFRTPRNQCEGFTNWGSILIAGSSAKIDVMQDGSNAGNCP